MSNENFKQSEILSSRNARTSCNCPNESLSTETKPRKNLKTNFGIYYVQRFSALRSGGFSAQIFN